MPVIASFLQKKDEPEIVVVGPDGNRYHFKAGTKPEQIQRFYRLKGIKTAEIGAAPSPWSMQGILNKALTLRDKAVNQLPAVGGIAAPAVGALIAGPASVPEAAAEAAAGGVLGEDLRQSIMEYLHPEEKMTIPESIEGMAKQGAVQGLSELAFGSIGSALKPSTAIEKLAYVSDVHPETVERMWSQVAKTEKVPRNKVLTVGDYLNVLDLTKKRIRKQVDAALKAKVTTPQGEFPLGAMEANTTPISDAFYKLAAKHPSEARWNPEVLARLNKRASTYVRGRMSYAELFDRRQVLNESLGRVEAMTKGEKAAYLAAHPEYEADKVEADAIRELIYPKMDKAARHRAGYFENLQRQHGAIIEAERGTQKRLADYQTKGAQARGGPVSERIGASGYVGGEMRPGFSVHRLPKLLSKPAPERTLDTRAKAAFGHSATTNLFNVLSSKPSTELMSIPLRELFAPSEPEHK